MRQVKYEIKSRHKSRKLENFINATYSPLCLTQCVINAIDKKEPGFLRTDKHLCINGRDASLQKCQKRE